MRSDQQSIHFIIFFCNLPGSGASEGIEKPQKRIIMETFVRGLDVVYFCANTEGFISSAVAPSWNESFVSAPTDTPVFFWILVNVHSQ